MTMITISHLDAHDALDEDVTEDDAADPVAYHVQTGPALHHRLDVLGDEENQAEGDAERKPGQHPSREAALSAEPPHLAHEIAAPADGIATVAAHLRTGAAPLPPHHH